MSGPKGSGRVAEPDLAIVSGQLGRPARDVTGIAARCPFGRPAVIETSPRLGGRPNPTLLYLTCTTAVAVISRLEAPGGVKRFKAACRADSGLRQALEEVTHAYRRRRAALAPTGDPRPEAGIGDPGGPEKASCLHAYAAALLAARAGWFGPETAASVSPAAGDVARAAATAWDLFLPPRDGLWCTDDRCACWVADAEVGERDAESGAAQADGKADAQADVAHTGVVAATRPARVAAIDVGTISVRLLVADVGSGRPEEVFRQAEITRLGEGLCPGGRLSPMAKQRTAAVVARFARQARRLGAGPILLAGTSACREAADGLEFVRAIGTGNQVAVRVLSGAEEATFAYTGATLDLPDDPVVLDVGGGSTELIWRGQAGEIEAVSLLLGASRGTERWIGSDPPSTGEMDRLSSEAATLIEPLRARFAVRVSPAGRAAPARLAGVAGTVTTLACLDAGLQAYDAEVIHLRTLSLASIGRLVALLAGMTTAERAALPCVQAGRAPVIVAGALIVAAAMRVLGYEEMTVSERDILDGLALAAAC